MKVTEFKGRKLDNVCPLCGHFDKFKVYINGGECRNEKHNGRHFAFYVGENKEITHIGIVDGLTEITFRFDSNRIEIASGEKHFHFPFLDVQLENVTHQFMKELLVFT